MKLYASLALALCLTATLSAQTPARFTDPANLGGERVSPGTGREPPIDQGARGLQQLLRKLNTRASILNIVAHPDDEDGGLLTLYARGLGARVADLSLTRGEGGQNAMTGDFEDALGLLRTQELLANDRYTGVDQFFGTEVDFGFSKTKAESFAKWGHQRVLYDVVRAIRIYRPLVVTSTWIGNVTDGHGQHQVSGEIAQEAFKDAGDPKVFPELTAEGILPWQPLKMYARVPRQAVTTRGVYDYATGQYTPARFTNYITGEVTTTPPSTDIVIHEGTTDPLITTCAADADDLPPSLRAASVPSIPSSRPEPAHTLSSRPEASRSGAGAERPAFSSPPARTGCRPLSYVQFARIGLGLQKSQIGPGVRDAPSGRFDVPYHLYGSRPGVAAGFSPRTSSTEQEGALAPDVLTSQPSFFDGIDTSLVAIAPAYTGLRAPLAKIAALLQQATTQYNPAQPQAIAPILADALQKLDELIGYDMASADPISDEDRANILHELRIKRVQLNDALALALGLQLRADIPEKKAVASLDEPIAPPADITPAQEISVRFKATVATPQSLRILGFDLKASFGTNAHSDAMETDGDSLPGIPFPANGVSIRPLTVKIPASAKPTQPYFHRSNIEQPYYDLADPALRDAPATPPPLVASVTLSYRGTPLTLAAPVVGLHEYPGDASIVEPISIVPPLNVSLSAHAQVVPLDRRKFEVSVTYRSESTKETFKSLRDPSGVLTEIGRFNDLQKTYEGSLPNNTTAAFNVTAVGILHTADGVKPIEPLEGYRAVGYPGLISTNYYTPATDRIAPVNLKLPPANQRRIGYLPGTGDAVPEVLASIGLQPTILSVADLTPAKLSQFDTVILGVRTYAAHPDLHGAPTRALLDFARGGGNVLVQYQTSEFTAADAPFPLDLGSDEKVVDETANVQLLATNSPLLHHPNTINPADFNGWIEERGHGFLGSWDPRYTALTETHDPGQAPQKGGLITTQLGKGRWTYCAFALYRQLPEAVPGAYRLFVNLLTP